VRSNRGASLGSGVLGSTFGVGARFALRVDAGVERLGLNGGSTSGNNHVTRFVAGAGPYFRVPLAPNVEFVWGRTGVARMFRFTNVGTGTSAGTGFYLGGSFLPIGAAADTLVISTGHHHTGTLAPFSTPPGIPLR